MRIDDLRQRLQEAEPRVEWIANRDATSMHPERIGWQKHLGGIHYGMGGAYHIVQGTQYEDAAWEKLFTEKLRLVREDIARIEAKTGLKFAVG